MLIEDKASGQSLIQELRHDTKMPLRAVKVDRDKKSRARAVTGLIEAGRVYLPERAQRREPRRDNLFTGSWWNCREIAGVLFHRILDIGVRLEKRGELGVVG